MKKLLVLVICLTAGCAYIVGKGDAEKEATAFARQNYPGKRMNVSCMDRDTDNDGYVSCALIHQPKEGEQMLNPVGLQCSTNAVGSSGCGNGGCKLSAVR